MDGAQIRERFLSFFEAREHQRVPSSSLIPNAPGLLLTTAGMVQFRPYFLGEQDSPYPRATSAQKSFRTTDIDQVGLTDRHLTFFEMLGNFSFGDYFKEEAIAWAFELVTEGYGIDADRVWATVYETDDEAAEIWAGHVPGERIVRRGKADNFWSMGVAGPCGPCSEVYVDRGPGHGREGGPAVDEDRYLEIWNLVFMQNECNEQTDPVGDLPKKNIDTGSGLERLAVVLQDVGSAFETDLIRPLLEEAERLADRSYGKDQATDRSLRILAEHGRAATFLIADGVVPSNEGRGYVLRRMLRRVVSHARRLGIESDVTPSLVERTVEMLGEPYPELEERKPFVLQVAASEEEHFGKTLRQGIALFEEEVSKTKAEKAQMFSGEAAFRYHDTYGFPIELTVELAREVGLEVDTEVFERLMDEQRSRARAAAKRGEDQRGLAAVAKDAGTTEFLGYEHLESDGEIAGLLAGDKRARSVSEGGVVDVLLNRTPFYPEGGGQVGDTGVITTETAELIVEDTVPGPGETVVHRAKVAMGEVRTGQEARARVDADRRAAVARSHTGTHIAHWTLRHLLGEHARQAGSLVAPGRIRFDFTHFEAPSRSLLEEVEGLANRRLLENDPVRAYETTFEYARGQGAIALFGEKYGDIVRVVEIGDYSVELCGGTHVPRTAEVSLFLIASEASIGSGLRRIEALVGSDALTWVNRERRLLAEVAETLGAGDAEQTLDRARRAIERIKELESSLGRVKKQERGERIDELIAGAQRVDGVSFVVSEIPGEDAGGLRELALAIRSRMEKDGDGAAVLGSADGTRALLVASCTKSLVDRGIRAPKLLEEAAKAVGGGAGGKDHLAFAGGGKSDALSSALEGVGVRLKKLLTGD
ncbi:MAG: alanine--tRNA ligase [Actinomycetota bacterium]